MLVMKVIAIPWIPCTDQDPFWCPKLTSAHLWIMAPPHLWAHSEHQDTEQEELRLEFVLIFNQRGNYDKSMLPLVVKPQDLLQGVKELVNFWTFSVSYTVFSHIVSTETIPFLNLEIVENSNVKSLRSIHIWRQILLGFFDRPTTSSDDF